MKVLYIAGMGRSGSTALARAIGAQRGCVYPGEPYYLWKEGVIEDRICECGEAFSTCAYWAQVMEAVSAEVSIDANALEGGRLRVDRTRRVPELAIPTLRSRRLRIEQGYRDAVGALYRAIGKVSRAEVLVDASKLPSHALVLREVAGIDLHVVHLIRDPRGVVNSWRRTRLNPASGLPFGQMGSLKASMLWGAWNLAIEATMAHDGRYLRVRYEDWMTNPVGVLQQAVNMVETPVDPAVVACDGTLNVPSGHTIGGNPARFEHGPVRLYEDTAWRTELPVAAQRRVVSILSPLMRRYGYRPR